MKILKLNETGESNMDLKYVEDNPDNDTESAGWIRYLKSKVDQIIIGVNNADIKISLKDIRMFDRYTGPYATVNIEGKNFKIWDVRQDEYEKLFIEDFPFDNQSEDGNEPGFAGSVDVLIEGIIDYFKMKNENENMKIEKFNDFQKTNESSIGMIILGAAALLKIVYNIIKRKNIVKGIKNHDLSKLEYIVNSFKDSKFLLGKKIDTPHYCQIIYKYGGDDNLIVFELDKINKKFIFKWEFTQPMLPFIKYSGNDDIEIDLTDDEIIKIQEIFNNLKQQKFNH